MGPATDLWSNHQRARTNPVDIEPLADLRKHVLHAKVIAGSCIGKMPQVTHCQLFIAQGEFVFGLGSLV